LIHNYVAVNLELAGLSVSGWNNLSLLSIIERSTNPDWSRHLLDWFPARPSLNLRIAAMTTAATVLAAAGWLWHRRRPEPSWTAAAWLALMPIPLGVCWTHYFLFALPLGFLAITSSTCPAPLRIAAGWLVSLVFVMMPLYAATPQDVARYAVEPLGFPWLHALPMALMAGVALASLRFAARVDGSEASVPGGGTPSSAPHSFGPH